MSTRESGREVFDRNVEKLSKSTYATVVDTEVKEAKNPKNTRKCVRKFPTEGVWEKK